MADIAELGIKIDSRDADTAQQRLDRLTRTGGRTQAMTGELTKTARGLALTLGAAGVAGAAALLQKAFRSSIQLGKDFTAQLSDLSAITGIVGDRLRVIGDSALNESKRTGRAATEIVEAYKLVASQLAEKIDFSTASGQNLLREVAEDAVTLSQAARIDLSQAVEAVSTALNQFNRDAESSREIINNLAAGSKFGAAEVGLIQEAMREAGSAAAGAGEDITTTNAAIQVLAANAITGSRAGTGLRNVFLRLQTESDRLARQGIKDVNIQSDGLVETLRKLRPLLSDAGALTDIFGQESFNAASILIQNVDSLERMESKLTDTNTATEQAAIQMDNLTGDIARLSRAVQTDLISSFIEGESTFRETVQEMQRLWSEFGDDFISVLNTIVSHTATQMKRWREIITGEIDTTINFAEDDLFEVLRKIDSRVVSFVVRQGEQAFGFLNTVLRGAFKELVSDPIEQFFPGQISDQNKLAARNNARQVIEEFRAELAKPDNKIPSSSIIELDPDEFGAQLQELFKQTQRELERTKPFKPVISPEAPSNDIILPDGTIIPADAPDTLRQINLQFASILGLAEKGSESIDWGDPLEDNIDNVNRLEEAGRQLGFTFSSAFEDAIVQGRRFGRILEGLFQDILRIIVRTQITEPLGTGFAGFLGGLFSGNTETVNDALITKSGKIIRFNPNDNIFAFQGASPQVGGPKVNVNVINQTGANVEIEERQLAGGGIQIDAIISNAVREGINRGRFDGALNRNFGINRRGRGA